MIRLETYLNNPFNLPKVGYERKKKLGEVHLQYLIVQNTSNQYSEAIEATTIVQNNMFGNITNVELNKAIRKSKTQIVNRLMEAFVKRNTLLNKYLAYKRVNDTPLYFTFFPQGIMEFTKKVNKGNVEQLMERMVDVISSNIEIAGGPEVLQEYIDFKNQYAATRSEQLSKIGQVSQGVDNRGAAEQEWANQLFKNLLLIASYHIDNPQIINSFFDQNIVDITKSADI